MRARRRRQRRSPASGLGRRGRLGFCCREARKIVRTIEEIEASDRSLDQCEPFDEGKKVTRCRPVIVAADHVFDAPRVSWMRSADRQHRLVVSVGGAA